jgi:tetratricopeptide (TPR) repeat protein
MTREQADHPQDIVRRLIGPGSGSVLDALRNVTTAPTELEDFRPLGQSLEWRLADAYWARAGVLPFVRNDVPYLVNNTGRLSENAAALVFAAFDQGRASLPERLIILELGAGTGLHARHFLDAFLTLCRREGSDFYDRLTYVVSDRFDRTVSGWQRDGLYAEHQEHVALRICDASLPTEWSMPAGGAAPPLGAPLVVFCNYVLDVLPSRIVRRSAAGLEELCVRTHLQAGAAALKQAGIASLDEARALAASGNLADLTCLLPLLPELELETAFRPWAPSSETEAALAAAITTSDRVILNGGALRCLDMLLAMLPASGFVLVNDYGPVRAEEVDTHVGVQRFGGSVALGLNFPLIERVLSERGFRVSAPEGDDQRRVHTRLIGGHVAERTLETLRTRFSLAADQHRDAPLEAARAHVAAGRRNDALDAYRLLIERNPSDWQMLGEAAEYVGLQLHDHAAGLELCRAALERNPWYSAWLWNVLGDCLFYREKLADAHAAFTQAQRIDADDPRTNLNLAYTLSARGEQDAALAAIARGLAHDGRGLYRPRLLEKQAQVLAIVSERAAAVQNRLVRRAERFR